MEDRLKMILEKSGFREMSADDQPFVPLSGHFMGYKISGRAMIGISDGYRTTSKYGFPHVLFVNDFFSVSACTFGGLLTDALVSLSLESVPLRGSNSCKSDERATMAIAGGVVEKLIRSLIDEGLSSDGIEGKKPGAGSPASRE